MLMVNEVIKDRYRIISQLGKGGMGAVYEAHDNVFDTTIALKEILLDLSKNSTPAQREMIKLAFEREGKILAKVNHESFPHVRDYFQDNDRQFLVMELVDGDDLGDFLEKKGQPLPVADVVRWSEHLLDALDYLHTLNPPVIHRDIKPQNLKVTSRGKIKLLDFGIAKGNESQHNTTITNQTFVAATLHYSPLEQIYRVLDPTFREVIAYQFKEQAGEILEQNADARSDIYALGATIYHLLTNTLPIDALKRSLEIWAGKPDPLVNAYAINPQIPPAVSNVIHRAMDIDHGRRFASAKEMQTTLHEAFKSEQERAEDSKRAAWQSEQQKMESERASILQERQRMETEREKYISQIEARNRQGNTDPKPTDAATVQMNQNDFNTAKTEAYNQSPLPPTPNSSTNQPSVETIAAPANFAVNIPETQTRLPETNTSDSPMTQGNFMPQSLMNKPKKKSNKLLWLVPVFGLLFLMLGGAGFGFYLWQKNRTATTANTNSTVANTSNTTNVQTLVETNTEPSPEPETVAEQGDLTGETNTAATVNPTDTKKTIVSRPPPEPPRKTTTMVATRPTPKPVVKTNPPPRKSEGAIP
ncbi:MAG: protein kinase domain-containing protein, partial [Pyrinomonadaceae bacterium]